MKSKGYVFGKILGDSSEKKVTDEFSWKLHWMFSKKHCFEKEEEKQ